jgi:hypothetical protein
MSPIEMAFRVELSALWFFRAHDSEKSSHPVTLRSIRWQEWLILLGMLLLAVGFIRERFWTALPVAHAIEVFAIATTGIALAVLVRKVARLTMATTLMAVFLAPLMCFAGLLPLLATSLLAVAALALGRRIGGPQCAPAIAVVAGLGIIAGSVAWALPFPLHRPLVYLCILTATIGLLRKEVGLVVHDSVAGWREAVEAAPVASACAVLFIGLASIGSWIPTVQFDDLAFHLGLPSQLVALGYYRLDAHSQIWALAPWLGDVVQAIPQVLGGSEARGGVDALWFVVAAVLAFQLMGTLGAPANICWPGTALLASQPLLAALLGGMQAELPATAVTLALVVLVARGRGMSSARLACLFGILAGLMLGLKTGFIAIVVPLAAWLLWNMHGRCSARGIAAVLALICFIGGSSYAYAYVVTGNPFAPLLNGVFHSAYFPPGNFSDSRWSAPLDWTLPWQLTFHTQRYAECWDGMAGFALLGLLGAIPVALATPRLRWPAICAMVASAAALTTVHYFRYAFPALSVLLLVCTAAVCISDSLRIGTWLLGSLIVMNLAYQGTSVWTLHGGAIAPQAAFRSRAPVLQAFAPERLLIAEAKRSDPSANVVLCSRDSPFAAELAGRGFVVSWYDPELLGASVSADEDGSGAGWQAIFQRTEAHFAIVSDATISSALRAALADAHLVRRIGWAQLWRLPTPKGNPVDLVKRRDSAAAEFRP